MLYVTNVLQPLLCPFYLTTYEWVVSIFLSLHEHPHHPTISRQKGEILGSDSWPSDMLLKKVYIEISYVVSCKCHFLERVQSSAVFWITVPLLNSMITTYNKSTLMKRKRDLHYFGCRVQCWSWCTNCHPNCLSLEKVQTYIYSVLYSAWNGLWLTASVKGSTHLQGWAWWEFLGVLLLQKLPIENINNVHVEDEMLFKLKFCV